jgi:hypothetical protein
MQLMRIGTWNLGNKKMSAKRRELLLNQNCDIWLLTEVNSNWFEEEGRILNFYAHRSEEEMSPDQYYAAVLSTSESTPFREKLHFASAAATIRGITYCSSVLPWLKAHIHCEGWIGDNHAERTQFAIESLLTNLPKENLVWGGDWNHSFVGTESAGSNVGRMHVESLLDKLGLQVPTRDLPHRLANCYSIDHIAVPHSWSVKSTKKIDATGLSDHDAYVVEVSPP